MLEFSGATFFNARIQRQDDVPPGPVLFEKCVFAASSVAVRSADTERISISGVTLRNCQVRGGGVRGLAISDSVVDGLQVRSLPQVLGCTFRHVTLRGRINQLIIRSDLPTVADPKPFDDDAQRTYAELDWALDISAVDSPDLNIRGIPSRLVIGDPQTQAVVPREVARSGEWQAADLSGTSFVHAIERLADTDWEDCLLVAPRTGTTAERAQAAIADLLSRGLAHPPRTSLEG